MVLHQAVVVGAWEGLGLALVMLGRDFRPQ